jgi:hypothetical protein
MFRSFNSRAVWENVRILWLALQCPQEAFVSHAELETPFTYFAQRSGNRIFVRALAVWVFNDLARSL